MGRGCLILFIIGYFAFFWQLGEVSFLENEGMYATITQEMVSSGDLVTLRFNGVRYFEKPPLFFWLTALIYSIFGPSESTTRLFSALPAFGLVLLTSLIGRRLFNDKAGLFAGLILASGFLLPLSARRASTDLLFSLFLALALYGFLKAIQEASPVGPLLFYLGVGLTVVAKGLIGFLLTIGIVGIYVLLAQEGAVLRRLRSSIGILCFLLLTIPWHLAAALKNEGFLWYYIFEHHLLRFLGTRQIPHDDLPVSTLGFLLVTAFWFFPWSVLLPQALADLLKRPRRPIGGGKAEERLWLLIPIWVLVVFGFFSASSFKHEYYALPALPALALSVGRLWAAPMDGGEGNLTRGRVIGPWLLLSFCGSILYLVLLFKVRWAFTTEMILLGLSGVNVSFRALLQQGIPLPESFGPGVFSLLALGGLFALTGFGGAWLFFRLRRPGLSFGALVSMGLAIGLLILPFFHLLEPYYSVKAVALAINEKAGPEDIIANEGRLERAGGLTFYTGRRIVIVNGREGSLRFGSSYPEVQGLFLGTEEFVRLWKGPGRIFLVTNSPFEKSVRGAIPPGTVHELGRYGLRWLFSNRDEQSSTLSPSEKGEEG